MKSCNISPVFTLFPLWVFPCLSVQGVIEFSLCLLFAKLVSYTFLFWLPLYITKAGEELTDLQPLLSSILVSLKLNKEIEQNVISLNVSLCLGVFLILGVTVWFKTSLKMWIKRKKIYKNSFIPSAVGILNNTSSSHCYCVEAEQPTLFYYPQTKGCARKRN